MNSYDTPNLMQPLLNKKLPHVLNNNELLMQKLKETLPNKLLQRPHHMLLLMFR
jgi:hypothetical protein